MTKDEIDRAREELRAELIAHPNKPYGMGEIGRRFGIPKHFIDRERALSYDGSQIFRSTTKDGGIRWTYVPKGSDGKVAAGGDYATELQQISGTLEDDQYFEAENIEDERKKTLQEVAQRQGQSKFRKKLISAYGGRCAVTGCDAEAALEAAHIMPYLGPKTNHVSNGLLLRADIHILFDLDLIGIDPESLTVALSGGLRGTCYDELQGKRLTLPKSRRSHPSEDALEEKWDKFVSQDW